MTYSEYRGSDVSTDDLKVFFAFSTKQFEEGLEKLNARHGTNLVAGDLCGAFGGMVGVKEDINEFYRRINEKSSNIKELFDPQEVYDYEFGNHECEYLGDDSEAIKIIVELFGAELARKVKRKCTCSTIGVIAPNFNELLNERWNRAKEKETLSGVEFMPDIAKWLRGFLTPEIEAELKAKGKVCIESNWEFWVTSTRETLVRFRNFGTMFAIFKETKKHQYCNASFFEYWVGLAKHEKDEFQSFIKILSFGIKNNGRG